MTRLYRRNIPGHLGPEESACIAFMDQVRLMERQWPELAYMTHFPAGGLRPFHHDKQGRRFSNESIKLQRMGVKKGVPDYILPVGRLGYCGWACEMKIKPNKPTRDQNRWLDHLKGEGWWVCVAYSAEDAIGYLQSYLGARDGA